MNRSSDPFLPCVGAITSADIAVPEHAREVSFYSRVLGTGPEPLWRDDLMNNCGMPVIGLGERSDAYAQLPLQWMPHIQVADVATSVARALSLGGSELMHGKDEAGNSQWAVLLDADGAAFGVIPVPPPGSQAGDAELPEDATRVGRITHVELTVTDAARADEFYGQVVGWTSRALDHAASSPTFELVDQSGNLAARILTRDESNSNRPAAWLLCLPVADFAASLERVREGGGAVLEEARAPEHGQFAVIRDPVGACLALVAP